MRWGALLLMGIGLPACAKHIDLVEVRVLSDGQERVASNHPSHEGTSEQSGDVCGQVNNVNTDYDPTYDLPTVIRHGS
jgi:hypothetical protein